MAFHTFPVFWVSESLILILNPIYTILQDSLEQKIIHAESDLSSFVEKEVIICLLSNALSIEYIVCLIHNLNFCIID